MIPTEITQWSGRRAMTGTVARRTGTPSTFILTESGGIITGLAPGEQEFIEAQPTGTKVYLVREMFATTPDAEDD